VYYTRRVSVSELPRRQREVFEYISRFYREKGYAPTMRDISADLGFASRSSAHTHVRVLEEKDFVERVVRRGVTEYRPVDRTTP
jgi:SOS-response transcriptional repressor LexA